MTKGNEKQLTAMDSVELGSSFAARLPVTALRQAERIAPHACQASCRFPKCSGAPREAMRRGKFAAHGVNCRQLLFIAFVIDSSNFPAIAPSIP
jgi:hypothetical protein